MEFFENNFTAEQLKADPNMGDLVASKSMTSDDLERPKRPPRQSKEKKNFGVYNFQGTHILGASRGHLSDSVIFLLNVVTF